MRMRVLSLAMGLIAASGGAFAQGGGLHGIIERTAMRLFDEMPHVEIGFTDGQCGAGEGVHAEMAYCTTRNVILLRGTAASMSVQTYELAHLYGHAVQVRHGIADIALREIRARPDEEEVLRGMVTRQVECVAGFIYAQSGLPFLALTDVYDVEPLTDSHWGRNPLSVGPKVSIGLEARTEWFERGQKGELAACAVGEIGSELLMSARR